MSATAERLQAGTAVADVERGITPKALGLLLAALFPAVFWTSALAIAGSLAGVSTSIPSLLAFGAAIAMFLTAVCAPIMLRA